MFVPEKLKVNKFADVRIPSNKDYFQRVGVQALPEGQYTGDEFAPMPTDKVSSISAEEQRLYDEMRQAEELNKDGM